MWYLYLITVSKYVSRRTSTHLEVRVLKVQTYRFLIIFIIRQALYNCDWRKLLIQLAAFLFFQMSDLFHLRTFYISVCFLLDLSDSRHVCWWSDKTVVICRKKRKCYCERGNDELISWPSEEVFKVLYVTPLSGSFRFVWTGLTL